MNETDILQALKDGIITAEDAMKYITKIAPRNATDSNAWMDYNVEVDEEWGVDFDSPYDEPTLEELRNTANILKQEVNNVVRLWTGLFKTDFKALTPDILTDLNERCKKIQTRVAARDGLHARCQELGHDPDELYELHVVYTPVERQVIHCIMQSWCMSTGQSVAPYKPTSIQMPDDFDKAMLRFVKVSPWEMPPCPPLVIPERPAAILEVMKVHDGHVAAGWDDVFNPIVIVEYLSVDEELVAGDRIIVKGSKWNPKTHLIQDPEYDGMAEPDCPLSTEDDLLALKYTFNADKEQEKLLARHKKEWVRKHWRPLTESQILKIADGGNIDEFIEPIEFDLEKFELLKQMDEWKYQINKDLYLNEYKYEKYTYNEYDEVRSIGGKYMSKIINKMEPIVNLKVT